MQQISYSVQKLAFSNNAQNPDIDNKLRLVSQENSLPSIEVIHYAIGGGDLYNNFNFTFCPTLAVKEQLYYAAHTREDQNGIHLGEGFNYTNLSASDTAALFYILNSFQAYEKDKKGELAIFPRVVFYFEQYILRLCNLDEEKARRVLDALISYNSPSNDVLIEKMRSSLTAIAKTNAVHNQGQFSLSEDIWLEIFKNYLPPKDLGRVALACRQFRRLTSDNFVWNAIEKRLANIYPSLKVIGPEAWRQYVDLERFGLNVEQPAVTGAATGSKRASLIPIFGMLDQVASKVEGNAGITVLTIPKGLTLNKLVQIAESPKRGHSTGFSYISQIVREELGNIAVEKTYQIVITNNIVNGSRGMSGSEQQMLAKNLGCEFPGILDASTLCILTAIISQNYLCGNNPLTYTRCWQKLYGLNVVIGAFAPDGLDVYYFDTSDCGVMVLRKIPGIET